MHFLALYVAIGSSTVTSSFNSMVDLAQAGAQPSAWLHHVYKQWETKVDGDVLQRWTKKSKGLVIQWMHNQVLPRHRAHRHSIPALSFQSDSRYWNTGSSEAQLYTCLKHATCICSVTQCRGNTGKKTWSCGFFLLLFVFKRWYVALDTSPLSHSNKKEWSSLSIPQNLNVPPWFFFFIE